MLFLKEFKVQTNNQQDFIDITGPVSQAVAETGILEGSVLVFIPHTTAAVTLNENADPDVMEDIKGIVQKLVPLEGPYRHREGNTAAHMMTSLMGNSQIIPIQRGRLLLGTWQGIYLAEFDGPRERRVVLQLQGEG